MKYAKIISLSVFTLLCHSCSENNRENAGKKFDFPDFTFSEKTRNQIENQFNQLQKQMENLFSKFSSETRQKASVNLRAPVAFHTILSNAGHFFLSVDSVEEHREGYRLKLRLGNPYAADFNDLTLKLTADNPPDKKHKEGLIESSVVLSVLKSSSWRVIEINIPASKEAALERVSVELNVHQLHLLK